LYFFTLLLLLMLLFVVSGSIKQLATSSSSSIADRRQVTHPFVIRRLPRSPFHPATLYLVVIVFIHQYMVDVENNTTRIKKKLK